MHNADMREAHLSGDEDNILFFLDYQTPVFMFVYFAKKLTYFCYIFVSRLLNIKA